MQGISEILDFWFAPETTARWFDPTPEFDMTVRRRFGELYARAATDRLKHWEDHPDGCVALCILFDQMSRNIFRGDARAFATDQRALDVAERALAAGFDRRLPQEQKQFLYMPFMHSENLANQLRSLALFEGTGLTEARKAARDHLEIIRRFGRFPHRNQSLGRQNTPEEAAYLKANPQDYGQKALRAGAATASLPPAEQEDPAQRNSGSRT